ncbi:MAG: discoidin domain-containing protein, partial [Alphaproteobacteria bacterium]|nr:discoidin domain-containing protein [Alphaproteobacteria bacterium]MBM3654596.1 discoidin domain-containing protein [Alphaproteobacteria bacterium]
MDVPHVPHKGRWKITADSGDPGLAIDDHYATTWRSDPSTEPWLEIDLGMVAKLGGLEVYWGKQTPISYGFESSLDRETWTHLCRTRHGEGGQEVFAFPPVVARFVRWRCANPEPARAPEIIEINLYSPANAASVIEEGRIAALGYGPVNLPPGESITVDFGYVRFPLGAFIKWGETHGTVFSVYLSDDGANFR